MVSTSHLIEIRSLLLCQPQSMPGLLSQSHRDVSGDECSNAFDEITLGSCIIRPSIGSIALQIPKIYRECKAFLASCSCFNRTCLL